MCKGKIFKAHTSNTVRVCAQLPVLLPVHYWIYVLKVTDPNPFEDNVVLIPAKQEGFVASVIDSRAVWSANTHSDAGQVYPRIQCVNAITQNPLYFLDLLGNADNVLQVPIENTKI